MHHITQKTKLLLFVLPLTLFATGILFLVRTGVAHADTINVEYKDYTTISVSYSGNFTDTKNRSYPVNINKASFTKKNAWDSNFEYDYSSNGCDSKLTTSGPGATSGKLHLNVSDPYDSNQCIYYDLNVGIANQSAAVFANWTSSNVVTTIPSTLKLAQQGSTSTFTNQNNDNLLNVQCSPSFGCNKSYCTVTLTAASDNKHGDVHIDCHIDKSLAPDPSSSADLKGVILAGTPNNPVKPPTQGGQTGGGGGTSDQNTIDCTWDANPLTWVVCPLVDGMKSAINTADDYITGALKFNTGSTSVFSGQYMSQYYAAWSSFRTLATALLVIAGLVMVASQAIGFEVLDAYTIRKVLPRLLVAIIGITLSWPLMQFAVNFFNVLGVDVRELIFAPFSSIHTQLSGSTLLTFNMTLLLGGVFLGILGALSLGITALLAILVGFAIILARDLALILIIIVAPIAIACYILPNTQKVWKIWIDNFLGLLMVFPIIEAFIAVGRVFSAIALGPANVATGKPPGSGTFEQVLGFAAYFAPYFLLPVAFRLATGFIGAIAGFANDRGRGAFDRLKKYRGNKIAANSHAMTQGTRFNNRGLNALTSRATTKRLGFGAQGKAAYNQKMDLAAAEFAKSNEGQAVQHNDGALRAMTYGSAIEAKSKMAKDWGMSEADVDSAIAAAKANGGFGRNRQVWAAQQLSNTGTGYDNLEQVSQTIARASHGNADQIASLSGNINSGTKSAGRHDLAPGYAGLNDLSRQAAGLSSTGAGAGGAAMSLGEAQEKAWGSGSLYQHANDKGKNIQNAIDHHTGLLTSTNRSDREKAAVFFNELKALQPNASGDVKDKAQAALDSNRAALDSLYDPTHANYLGDSTPGIADKSTGRTETQVYDPSTGNYTKQVASTGTRSENARERVERLSRTYERPDPNNI